jgi:hypothetical protein
MPVSFSSVIDYASTPGQTLVPLGVRLHNSRTDKRIPVEGVQFSAVMPGGYETATLTLMEPLESSALEIAHLTDCFIYDRRSAEVVWQGRLKAPGRGGLVQQVQAEGPMAHLEDRTRPFLYADTRQTEWEPSGSGDRQIRLGSNGDDTPDLEFQWPKDTAVSTSKASYFVNRAVQQAGHTIARFRCDWSAPEGWNSDNMKITLRTRTDAGSQTEVDSDLAFSLSGTLAANITTAGGTIPVGDNVAYIRVVGTGTGSAATSALEEEVLSVTDIAIVTRRYLRDGTILATGYTVNNVDPEEIAADMLGRILTGYDGAGAVIGTSGYDMTQAAWSDPVTSRKVFDDLLTILGDWYYAAWGWTDQRKWAFEFTTYPTTVGFRLRRSEHQFDPPTGVDPFNEVAVRWTDSRGRVRTTFRTLAVPALTAAGLTRTASIDLGDPIGSTAAADSAGDVFLATSQTPTVGGRAVVTGPLFDRTSGRTLLPHQLPRYAVGQLVRVDVSPGLFAASPVRNGVDVCRVVRCEYDSGSGAATLELDAQFRFTARQARLERVLAGRRRR